MVPEDDSAVKAHGPQGTIYHLDPLAMSTARVGCPAQTAIALTTWVQACMDVESLGDLSVRRRLAKAGLRDRALALVTPYDGEPTITKAAKKPMPGTAGRQVGDSLDCAFWAVEFIIGWALANPSFDNPTKVSFDAKHGQHMHLNAASIRDKRVAMHERMTSAATRQRMYLGLGRRQETGLPRAWLRYPTRLLVTIHSGKNGNCVPTAIAPFQWAARRTFSEGTEPTRAWLVRTASQLGEANFMRYSETSVCMPLAVVDDTFKHAAVGCLLFIVDHNPTHRRLCAVARVGAACPLECDDVLAIQGCSGFLVYDVTRRHLTSLMSSSSTEALAMLKRARQHALVHDERDVKDVYSFGWLDGHDADNYKEVLAAAPSLTLTQRAFLAGGDVGSPPSFCRSFVGGYDEDGLAHGEGKAELLCSDVLLSGEWCAGLPCGSVSLGPDGGAGCFLHVDTELPTSPQYHLNPGLLAPGFLWPRPSAVHNGRRVVTLQVFTDASTLCGQRSYEVTALNGFQDGMQLIALKCVDNDRDCVAGASLPPRVSQGIWVGTQFEGDEAIVCYRQANALQEAITWFGSVQGTSKLPFARQGAGRLIVPRVQSPTKLAVLRGHWWADKQVVRRGEQCSSLMTLDETPTVILRSANECHMCHEVYSALTTRAHSCGHEPYTWVHNRPGVRPALCEDQTIPKDQTTLGEFKPGGTHRRLARGSPSLSAHHVRCGRFAQQALRRWLQSECQQQAAATTMPRQSASPTHHPVDAPQQAQRPKATFLWRLPHRPLCTSLSRWI